MSDNATQGRDGVIETASATTSPDNTNSGPAAYIICAGALVVVMLLSWGLGSCVGGAVAAVAASERIGRHRNNYYDYDYDDYDDYVDDLNNLYDMDIDQLERYLLDL